jgi:prepilin-type processing-associated H-X9-DG protein
VGVGTPDGPYGTGAGKLMNSASSGFACAADAFAPMSEGDYWALGTSQVYNHYMNGQILGFNVLYFDGSVQWWSNNNNVLVNAGDPSYGNLEWGPPDFTFFWVVRQQ